VGAIRGCINGTRKSFFAAGGERGTDLGQCIFVLMCLCNAS